jgi:hypothetical protein
MKYDELETERLKLRMWRDPLVRRDVLVYGIARP